MTIESDVWLSLVTVLAVRGSPWAADPADPVGAKGCPCVNTGNGEG